MPDDTDDTKRLREFVADLQAQRARLLEEVARLKKERSEAIALIAEARQENARLRAAQPEDQ